jgi:hypothetical protein
LTRSDRAAEAQPLLRECLTIREKKLPPDHWRTAAARSLLGGCLAQQKNFAAAEPLLLTGYEGLTRGKFAPARRTAEALDRLVDLYEKWDKPEQVEVWRKKRSPARK